jgi:hypothetical protein
LIKSQAFGQVLDTVPTPLPSDMVMVDGDIAGFDKDSTALRWIIGLGAGARRSSGISACRRRQAGSCRSSPRARAMPARDG